MKQLLETQYARMVLAGLQRLPHVYEGTVPAGVVRQRRQRAKRAKRSRKINRS